MTKPKHKPKFPADVQAARNALRIKGWTQKQAAELLGVSYVHLNYVVTNLRTSAKLIRRIHQLPENPNPN